LKGHNKTGSLRSLGTGSSRMTPYNPPEAPVLFAPIARSFLLLAALTCALGVPSSATATERRILKVELDAESRGVVHIGVRDAAEVRPTIHPGSGAEELATPNPPYDLEISDRHDTAYWKPFVIVVDTTNNSEERLARIKQQVMSVARRELDAGSRWVWLNNESNSSVKANKPKDVEAGGQVHSLLAKMKIKANPDPSGRTPHSTPISPWLEQLLRQGTVTRGAPTALIFSSLCVGSPDKAPEVIAKFPGPMRFFTWSEGTHSSCAGERDRWLSEARAHKADIEVFDYDDSAAAEAIAASLLPREDVKDEFLTLSGVPYPGGVLDIVVALEGVDSRQRSWTKEDLEKAAGDWPLQAAKDKSGQVIYWSIVGLILTVLLSLLAAVIKARSQGMEVARWEAVGEAEDLSTNMDMDPDAWNATIFQLTGAMPVLNELREAAQLGPAKDESTVDAPAPEDLSDEPSTAGQRKVGLEDDAIPTAPDGEGNDEEDIDETAAAASTSATPTPTPPMPEVPVDGPPSTGMTVGMPALDDGTGYDADSPFEIGVLQFGKPVARKTKRFRKVFSIGRATDNRVVIQKDDTVHRYHVVIRPAMQGKEWWLEVSPSASNRTNLNGKDLRSGGRYRLPAKFRLQLGEATEVRGRAVDA
jgi:hypothetical protein